jgi:hypothetical protein
LDANGEADVWTTPGLLYKFVLANALNVIQWTVDNVPSSGSVDSSSTDPTGALAPGGRLTVSSGNPVSQTDVSSALTVFYASYLHNKVPVYDGVGWSSRAFTSELSQALADTTKSPLAAAANSTYDMFVWDDLGTLRLSRGPAWTSSIPPASRGTGAGTSELARVDGRRVNAWAISNGPAAQRGLYVGTIYVGAAGVSDSIAFRHVWNFYNRVRRCMEVYEATSTWIQTTPGTVRQANGSAANQLDFVIGINDDPVWAEVVASAAPSGSSANATFGVGIGVNVATLTGGILRPTAYSGGPNQYETATAVLNKLVGIGRTFLVWMEYATATNNTSWYGGAAFPQSGIFGYLMA